MHIADVGLTLDQLFSCFGGNCELLMRAFVCNSFIQVSSSLRFARRFAYHTVNRMDRALQFFPECLINHLLSLHGPLSFKVIGHDRNGNMRPIGVIVGSW